MSAFKSLGGSSQEPCNCGFIINKGELLFNSIICWATGIFPWTIKNLFGINLNNLSITSFISWDIDGLTTLELSSYS